MTYSNLLDPKTGLQPGYVDALGWRWSSATGSEVTKDMPWCCQVDEAAGKMRYEVRNSPNDNGPSDPDEKRRAELSTTEDAMSQAHNGSEVWNAYLFKMEPWADRAGMAQVLGSNALSISQLKPNSGGSPTRAHRLTKDGAFRATVTGDSATNRKIYTGTVRLDDGKEHSFVERVKCDASGRGEWDLWLDGEPIVTFRGDMGTSTNGYSPSFGIYSASGVACTLIAEYAEIDMLSATSLLSRVTAPPKWPTNGEPIPPDPEPEPEPEPEEGAIVCPTCGTTGTIEWTAPQ